MVKLSKKILSPAGIPSNLSQFNGEVQPFWDTTLTLLQKVLFSETTALGHGSQPTALGKYLSTVGKSRNFKQIYSMWNYVKSTKCKGIHSSLANIYGHIEINQKLFGRLKSFVLINTILLSPIWKVRQDMTMTTVHQKCGEEMKASITKHEKLGVIGTTLTITLFSTVKKLTVFHKVFCLLPHVLLGLIPK